MTATTTRPGGAGNWPRSSRSPIGPSGWREITAPTLVLHGLADPVIAPSGGLALARAIPGARFVGFSGMGHDLPRALWPTVVDELVAHFSQTQ